LNEMKQKKQTERSVGPLYTLTTLPLICDNIRSSRRKCKRYFVVGERQVFR